MIGSLLHTKEVAINDYIKVSIPTVGEVLEYGEKEYYSLLTSFISTPYEMMAQLHLAGVDYEKISDYELFINMVLGVAKEGVDTRLIFGDLDLSLFSPTISKEHGNMVLYDAENDRLIDEHIHSLICQVIRKMLFSEKPNKKAGNNEAKKFLIRRAVEKYKRQKNKPYVSYLDDLIIALVNTEQFKYNYEATMDLSLYRFNASVRQIPRKVNYDHIMGGVYAGTLKYSELNQRDLNWLTQQ